MQKTNGWPRLAATFAGLVVLGLAGPFWADDAKKDGDPKKLDRAINAGLREAINHGASLYNDYGDQAGCYRVFHGALLAVKPLLAHQPQLQKAIEQGIAAAERNPSYAARAFALRKVLDDVRSTLVPSEKGKKEEKKKVEEKKIEKKAEEKKKVEEKKVIEKKVEEKKTIEKKKEKKVSTDPKKDDKKKAQPGEKKAEFIDLKTSYLVDDPCPFQQLQPAMENRATAWLGRRLKAEQCLG